MDLITILEDVIQEKLFSKTEKLEVLEVVVEKLRKKICIMILFGETFSPMRNTNKLE